MAFFDNQPKLQDSDKERIEFAKFYLKDHRYLYKNSKDVDNKVCNFELEHDPSRLSNNNIILIRNGRGCFAAPSSSRLSLLILAPSRVM
jgi:hypothetical protein